MSRWANFCAVPIRSVSASVHSREWGANAAATTASGAFDGPLPSPRVALSIIRRHTERLRTSGYLTTLPSEEQLEATSVARTASRVRATSSIASLSADVAVVTRVERAGVAGENLGVPRRRHSAVAAASAALVSSR